MFMRSIILCAAALVALSSTTSAFAQTAEETVSFILYGVEDGTKVVRGDAVVATVAETAKSPATYVISPAGKLDFDSVSVKEVEKCKFEVIRTIQSKQRTSIYDFNKLSDVTFTLGYGLLNFAGKCAIKDDDGSCNPTTLISDQIKVPPQRIMKAIDFMKATYCVGSAF